MKDLFQENMKNLKFTFEEKEANIKYNEYYFSGIQQIKDINIKEIGVDNFKLMWKLDDINITNIDKNKIKYKVEIKKENEKEKFIQVYEGSNNNCLIENLKRNTRYEIRICACYNDLNGCWSKIEKVKTSEVDSNILNESKKGKEFLEKIYEWSGYKNMDLLYRGSRDGSSSSVFHKKCDNQGPTICLYKTDKGYIFGGFSSISWTSDGNTHSASDCFIFTLSNVHGTEPTKFKNKDTSRSVYHNADRGPCFGEHDSDICIYEDYKNKESLTAFPERYDDSLGKGKSIFSGDLYNGNKYKLQEIEVFRLLNK